MIDVPEHEAVSLLSTPKTCLESPDWVPMRKQPDTLEVSVGVLDQDEARTTLLVSLKYRNSRKTGIKIHIFTVFQREPGGLKRVYQLDVRQFRKALSDAHKAPHEHFGRDVRVQGSPLWSKWAFNDILKHFSKRTNIRFQPQIGNPEELRLVG